jgi:periplasmic divalent cation tolerance protein
MHMVVFITAGGRAEAEKIGNALVEGRLAACANIVGPISSVYRWEGAVERAEEYLVIAKTVQDRLEELAEAVKRLHSYSLPEVIALKVEGGSLPYLRWLEEGSAGPESVKG